MLFAHLKASDVPDRLVRGDYVLRPIVAADTELDYEAVMASRKFLRPWEQTGWPTDDFTLEEDRADVVDLENRHNAMRAFTWTVMNPQQTECLGCVYIMPPDAKTYRESAITELGDARWEDFDGLVNFWVRTSRLADGLDERVLADLRAWFATEGGLGRLLYVTNEQVEQQVELFEGAGLQRLFAIKNPAHSGAYLAFA